MEPKDGEKQWCQPPVKPGTPVFVPRLIAAPVVKPPAHDILKPVVTFIRRIAALISLIPYCGVWQRKILARFDQWICLLTCDGGIIGEAVTVTDSFTLVRIEQRRAKKTYVTNTGDNPFKIYEGDGLVRVLYPDDTWESPTTGQTQINAMCDPGLSSTAFVTTELRCACGIADYYSYDAIEPIGGPLI